MPGKYARVLLKLSGESLCDSEQDHGINPKALAGIAGEIKLAHDKGGLKSGESRLKSRTAFVRAEERV